MINIAWFYTNEYQDKHNLLHRTVTKEGGQSISALHKSRGNWVRNCNIRPEFIKSVLESHGEAWFLDADCVVRSVPSYPTEDLAFSLRETGALTSVMFMRASPLVMDLVNSWVAASTKLPDMPDNIHFYRTWKAQKKKPTTTFLDPDVYCVRATEPSESKQQGKIYFEHNSKYQTPAQGQFGIQVSKAMSLEHWNNQLLGSHIVVAGCGPSTESLSKLSHLYWTIGVNDIGRWWTPDFLVVVDAKRTFTQYGRWIYVEGTKAGHVFYNQGYPLFDEIGHPSMTPFKVEYPKKGEGIMPLDKEYTVPCMRSSVHSAAGIALRMGAAKVGIIGADHTDDHNTKGSLRGINAMWGNMREQFEEKGTELVNLSSISAITSLPLASLKDFDTKESYSSRIITRLAAEVGEGGEGE